MNGGHSAQNRLTYDICRCTFFQEPRPCLLCCCFCHCCCPLIHRHGPDFLAGPLPSNPPLFRSTGHPLRMLPGMRRCRDTVSPVPSSGTTAPSSLQSKVTTRKSATLSASLSPTERSSGITGTSPPLRIRTACTSVALLPHPSSMPGMSSLSSNPVTSSRSSRRTARLDNLAVETVRQIHQQVRTQQLARSDRRLRHHPRRR